VPSYAGHLDPVLAEEEVPVDADRQQFQTLDLEHKRLRLPFWQNVDRQPAVQIPSPALGKVISAYRASCF
jgi:hypothetical protein